MSPSVAIPFVCPACGRPLSKPGTGSLECVCGLTAPVVDGIPRFVASQHLESFARQWNRFEVAHDDEDRATFTAKTGQPLASLAGRKVLDAGCGGGRYSKVAGEAGATVIGADHSTAVNRASRLCAHLPSVSFVQADLKHLPLPKAEFDLVFSIGVMHHDVQTRAVFDAVAKHVKPGGQYAVWLYRKNQAWQEALNDAARRITTRTPHERLEEWCRWGAWLGGIPVVNQTLNKVLNFSAHADPENRLCDTFDWYAPEYQHHHTTEELLEWYHEAGFVDCRVLPPEKTGRFYRAVYNWDLLIGSGVNIVGTRAG